MSATNGHFVHRGALIGEVRFDGMHGSQDCMGTFRIAADTGFQPEMAEEGHLASSGTWFRIDRVFEIKREDGDYLVSCHAERDPSAEHE
jgi:hypothetical protein